MKDIFSADNILLNASFHDKWEAIEACGRLLLNQGYIFPEYIEDMKQRHRDFSVYIGNHVAIPHGIAGSERYIIESGLSFIQIPDGVDFDGETCYLMLGIAGKDGTHLDMLGRISNVIVDEANILALTHAKTKEEILSLFSSIS